MFSQRRQVSCDCERLFDVVADVARYPEFVPGWHEVRVMQRDSDLLVDQRLGFGAAQVWVRSRARMRRPCWILVRPERSDAAGVELEWHFERQVTGGCEVLLHIRGQAASRLVAMALESVIKRVGGRLVEVFAARAEALYGSPCGTTP